MMKGREKIKDKMKSELPQIKCYPVGQAKGIVDS
jgi:hypothetical protein